MQLIDLIMSGAEMTGMMYPGAWLTGDSQDSDFYRMHVLRS